MMSKMVDVNKIGVKTVLFTLVVYGYLNKQFTQCTLVDAVPIDEVHIIFMNHLDVGYDGISPEIGYINNIINKYFTQHIPRAVNLSRELRNEGYVETFVYTTHPWLVSLYVNCPSNFTLSGVKLKCPSSEARQDFIDAIQHGDISYHAGPMNMQPENMDQMLFELSLNISQDLDTMFNINKQYRTLSQRDVPGMTIAVVPTLVKKGIVAVTVGVNDATSAPAVPKIFTWRFDNDNEVIAMWHAGGYPDNPGPTPNNPGGISREDCVTIQNYSKALCFAFRTDNSGPPLNIQEILGNYEILRSEFPGAKLFGSTFENFIREVQPIKNQLPVVTNEIADTWISGIASDPRKMAEYRVATQTLSSCIREGRCSATDSRITDAVFYLIKPGEHTWGLPGLSDRVNWTNHAFDRARSGPNYKKCEQSWIEQREFVNLAIQQLADHPVVMEIKTNLAKLKPVTPDLTRYQEASPTEIFTYTDGTRLGFGKDGSINHLYDPYNKMDWATSGSFGQFVYWSYNETDFDITMKQYHWNGNIFNKNNLTQNAKPESKIWPTQLAGLYKAKDEPFTFLVKIVMQDAAANLVYGAPREIWVKYSYSQTTDASIPGFTAKLQWFSKTSTRLPESLMFYFSPLPPVPSPALKYQRLATPNYTFKLRKLGQLVDPSNIVLNGSQYLHAVDSEVQYTDETGAGLRVITQDVPLVSLATIQTSPSPFPVPLKPLERGQIKGFAFNMYNNMWDTNYIMWYPYLKGDEDFSARFYILFVKKKD